MRMKKICYLMVDENGNYENKESEVDAYSHLSWQYWETKVLAEANRLNAVKVGIRLDNGDDTGQMQQYERRDNEWIRLYQEPTKEWKDYFKCCREDINALGVWLIILALIGVGSIVNGIVIWCFIK